MIDGTFSEEELEEELALELDELLELDVPLSELVLLSQPHSRSAIIQAKGISSSFFIFCLLAFFQEALNESLSSFLDITRRSR